MAERIVRVVLLLVLGASASAQVAIRGFTVDTPRDFGYAIGDRMVHRITLALNDPYRLQPDSLPRAGRLTHWLTLLPPQLSEQRDTTGTVYRIELSYQIVNLEPGDRQLSTPAQRLRFSDGQGRLSVTVPDWTFRVGRLSDPQRPPDDLQPERLPPPLSPPLSAALASGGGLLLALLALGYLYGNLPLGRRGPFARALRELRRLRHRPWDEPTRRRARRILHAAFDRTAGATLLARDLDGFIAAQRRFEPLRGGIAAFFERSEVLFYRSPEAGGTESLAELIRFCRACRDAERGLA